MTLTPRGIGLAAAAALFSGCMLAADGEPRFEVASLKRVETCAMQNSEDPGRISFSGDPLRILLAEAFAVKVDQISGPSWLDSDCFTVAATLPAGATSGQIPAMLRGLFTERMKLSSHKDTRSTPGYELVVDKNGPKIKPHDSGANARPAGQVTFGFGGTPRIKGATTMAFLARQLSMQLRLPVVDHTGLEGFYDVDLSWTPEASPGNPGDDPPVASIFTAVRESLGLRLDPHKEVVDVFVIDHIERLPSEN